MEFFNDKKDTKMQEFFVYKYSSAQYTETFGIKQIKEIS